MDTYTLVFVLLTSAAFAGTWLLLGLREATRGLAEGVKFFLDVGPRIAVAFLLAGLLRILVPQELIAQWLSDSSGLRGIIIGAAAGVFTPGGPFFQFPIIAVIFRMGAGAGPIVAYLTAWSLLGLHRVILWELPFLGPRLTVARIAVVLPAPIVAGIMTRWLLASLRIAPSVPLR
jgi:uncharacterized membrane protein YraQ (UPF0718 family)